jgi:hypothetical protein
MVLFRPDALLVEDNQLNKFQALITDDVFLGNQWRVKMMISDVEFSFIVDTPINSGSQIMVSFDPELINILQE